MKIVVLKPEAWRLLLQDIIMKYKDKETLKVFRSSSLPFVYHTTMQRNLPTLISQILTLPVYLVRL